MQYLSGRDTTLHHDVRKSWQARIVLAIAESKEACRRHLIGPIPEVRHFFPNEAKYDRYRDIDIYIIIITPLQFCGPSISTDLFLCTFSLQNSSRQGDEGPWVWLAYRAERCLFSISSHIFAPCFSTFVRRVHSQTFEGGIDAPRFLASEWVIGSLLDRVMPARDAGA